jgi:hypothetical protein
MKQPNYFSSLHIVFTLACSQQLFQENFNEAISSFWNEISKLKNRKKSKKTLTFFDFSKSSIFQLWLSHNQSAFSYFFGWRN